MTKLGCNTLRGLVTKGLFDKDIFSIASCPVQWRRYAVNIPQLRTAPPFFNEERDDRSSKQS